MKITLQIREPNKHGHRTLRLVKYHGSKTGMDGTRQQKRTYEPLSLFLYDNPRTPAQKEHNKTVKQQAEIIDKLLRIVTTVQIIKYPMAAKYRYLDQPDLLTCTGRFADLL